MLLDVQSFLTKEAKAGKTYLTVSTDSQVDEVALRTVSFSKPRFVPPVSFLEINGKQCYSYDIAADGFAPLINFTEALSPNIFIAFMKNVTEAVVQSHDYFLNPLNLLIMEDYLHIHPQSGDVRIIYMPLYKNVFSEADLNRQIFELSRRFSGKSSSSEWTNVILRLWEMTESTSVYDAKDVYTKLYNEQQRSQGNRPTPPRIQPASNIHPIQAQPQPSPAVEPPKKGGWFSSKPKEVVQPASSGQGIFGSKRETLQESNVFGFNKMEASGMSEKEQKKAKKEADKAEKKAKKEAEKAEKEALKQRKREEKEMQRNAGAGSIFGQGTPPVQAASPVLSKAPIPVESGGETMLMSAALYIMEHGTQTLRIPVNQFPFVIGRRRDKVNYCFDGSSDGPISREHAMIEYLAGRYHITDISANGTYVNNIKIEHPTPLNNGDIIKMGHRELWFEQT